MIAGLGLDIIEIDRVKNAVERYGDRFLARVFTPLEQQVLGEGTGFQRLAARFAAKEAVMKALGTGLGRGVTWLDVEVVSQGGPPKVALHGAAQQVAHQLGITGVHISLTHGRDAAAAVAVLEVEQNSEGVLP